MFLMFGVERRNMTRYRLFTLLIHQAWCIAISYIKLSL